MEFTEQDMVWAKETIVKTGLFSTCSKQELEELVNNLDKQQYKAGATIIFQGEISNRLCLLQSGKVEIFVRKGKDKNKVAELGPGSYFGEISLLTPRAGTATVKASEDTEIFFLPGEVVQSLVKKNTALADLINERIEERLKAQNPDSEKK